MAKGGGLEAADLFMQLSMELEKRVPGAGLEGADMGYATPGDWAVGVGLQLDRGVFTFEKHEYLMEPYADLHPYQVEKKCAQMGNTVRGVVRAMWYMLHQPIVGWMYLFPTRTGVNDFSRTRIDPLIADNPKSIGRYVTDTDSVALKRVKRSNLIMRGTKSEEGLRSDPVDGVTLEEFDLMGTTVLEVVAERMSHSDWQLFHLLSNPTIPDFGIDKAFQATDRRRWLLRCEACNGWTYPNEHFPDILHERPDGGVVLQCMHCRSRELNPALGQWVAECPSVTDRRGYHYSQLFSQYVKPVDLLRAFREAKNLGKFYNYKLGESYIEAENRLAKEAVLKLCGAHGIASSDRGPCVMGVDQGSLLHVTLGRAQGGVLHLGEYRDWEELDPLMKNLRVVCCVVDAMPETRSARAFAERHPGKVFLNYYNENQRGGAAWREDKMTVSVNRTESLDESHRWLRDGLETLPKECDVVRQFALHAHNVARKLEEDEESGSKRYVWVKLGPDHFRHAYNYMVMARERCGASFFGPCDLD